MVSLAGSNEDANHRNYFRIVIDPEEETVAADPSSENSLPFFAVKRLHIALKWVDCHLAQNSCNLFLNGFRKTAKILLGITGELTGPIHA